MVATASRPHVAASHRRGVTLVEMLVVVGLLVLMMSAIVVIFQSATSAVTAAQVYTELDSQLRRLDTMIRSDLGGVTARMTPPLDPKDGLGYFEYGEGSRADAQGEDLDDYVAFTAKAPPGQPFVGRAWVLAPTGTALQQTLQPISYTSEFAEIVYFVRNHNLYRRVFLIDPQRRYYRSGSTEGIPQNTLDAASPTGFRSSKFLQLGAQDHPRLPGYSAGNAPKMSWQGINDYSARPGSGVVNPATNVPDLKDVLPQFNSLGDLTERHNRVFRPRFTADYLDNATGALRPDGRPDDVSYDGIPDWYPTLYPRGFQALTHNITGASVPGEYLYRGGPTMTAPAGASLDTMAFPFIYRGMYSVPGSGYGTAFAADPRNTSGPLRWYHVVSPEGTNPDLTRNHGPLEAGMGDSLPVPTAAASSWFGFPIWRETLSANWTDPIHLLNLQANYSPGGNGTIVATPGVQSPVLTRGATFIPPTPIRNPAISAGADSYTGAWPSYSDQAGADPGNVAGTLHLWMPDSVWDEDLVATGVRSFDIKAYDPNAKFFDVSLGSGYYDLGYGYLALDGNTAGAPLAYRFNALNTMGHEGRIPPLVVDQRLDPNYPAQNVGDDAADIVRLQRVWDTWSTTYSNAPRVRLSEDPSLRPVYPSYPAPYPAPLRGLQIQIRVTDPRNERIKSLTIKVDFSSKL